MCNVGILQPHDVLNAGVLVIVTKWDLLKKLTYFYTHVCFLGINFILSSDSVV